jgi:hypothetical protein
MSPLHLLFAEPPLFNLSSLDSFAINPLSGDQAEYERLLMRHKRKNINIKITFQSKFFKIRSNSPKTKKPAQKTLFATLSFLDISNKEIILG